MKYLILLLVLFSTLLSSGCDSKNPNDPTIPDEEQIKRNEEITLQGELDMIEGAIQTYYEREKRLPSTLNSLKKSIIAEGRDCGPYFDGELIHPKTQKPYSYSIVSSTKYKLEGKEIEVEGR